MTAALLTGLLALPLWAGDGAAGRVIAVYPDRNTTKLVIESREPLVAATNIYAGPDEVEVTLGDVLSRSGELYYFSASVAGKADIKTGDAVITKRERRLETTNPLRLKLSESYTFEQKRKAEVTAVQDGRAMIDRGTLHEVRERDLYRVYGPDGRYKGLLEIRGIGDLQSSGVLYNALEDRRRDALRTVPGDRVVFAGQRKLFALGLAGGGMAATERVLGRPETTFGGGLLWDLVFRDGWGVEALFGGYYRELIVNRFPPRIPGQSHTDESVRRSALFLAPVWLKKNFFYPSVVSPFVAAGISPVRARLWYRRAHFNALGGSDITEDEDETFGVAPVLGTGVEFFPARFFRPRFEVRWFDAPALRAGRESFYPGMTVYSLGFFSTW